MDVTSGQSSQAVAGYRHDDSLGTTTKETVDRDTFEEDIWLIALLSTIIIILVLLSCSLRSTSHYFQESYLITRAKEWVQLPLLSQQQQHQQQQQQLQSSSLLAAESGINNDASISSVGSQPDVDFCSWESETSQTGGGGVGGGGGFEDAQEEVISLSPVMKLSSSLDADLCQRRGNNLLLLKDMASLSLTSSPPAAATAIVPTSPLPIAAVSSSSSSPQLTSKNLSGGGGQFFVFGGSGINDQLPLTKSESLDEARKGHRGDSREKCFKANRSVDEILGSSAGQQQQHGASSSSSSSASCTPKCRKLQERRGSNHSLTIAVKVTDAIATVLPTVTTPREW